MSEDQGAAYPRGGDNAGHAEGPYNVTAVLSAVLVKSLFKIMAYYKELGLL